MLLGLSYAVRGKESSEGVKRLVYAQISVCQNQCYSPWFNAPALGAIGFIVIQNQYI